MSFSINQVHANINVTDSHSGVTTTYSRSEAAELAQSLIDTLGAHVYAVGHLITIFHRSDNLGRHSLCIEWKSAEN